MTVKLRGGDPDGTGYDEGAANAGGGWEGAATAGGALEGAREPPAPQGAKSASGGSSSPASEHDGHPRLSASTREGAGEALEGRSWCDGEPDAQAEGEKRRDRLADAGDDGETDCFMSFETARLQPAKGKRLW